MVVLLFLSVAGVYLACGFVFALAFIMKGVQRVDAGARGAGIGFRIIIVPGVMVFWPLLLKKWLAAGKEKKS